MLEQEIKNLKELLIKQELALTQENVSAQPQVLEALEEGNISLQAELVAQKNSAKKSKIDAGVSLLLLALMSLYSNVSIRNNRKKILSFDEKLKKSSNSYRSLKRRKSTTY